MRAEPAIGASTLFDARLRTPGRLKRAHDVAAHRFVCIDAPSAP
jgi:hypothetical protein